jgi:formyl-CoA transferase
MSVKKVKGMKKDDFWREARRDIPGPLGGLRVLEATTSWAGPMCACMLADLGADVIKVEEPGGEVTRRLPPFVTGKVGYLHATVNRNKRSLTLDLRQSEGRDIFLKLAVRSDVVVENFRPGTLAGWGVGYEDVRRVKPDIVYVSISGWGQWGPGHERPGYDPVAEAASGFMAHNGEPNGRPVRCGTYIGDDVAGLHGALAALAALRHRDATGEGQHIDVALMDTLLFQSNGMLTLGAMGLEPPRMGNESHYSAPVGVFRCRDGDVFFAVLLDAHWRKLAGVIGRPEVGTDPHYATRIERVRRRGEVNAMMAEWMAEQTVDEVLKVCASEGIPAGPVRTYTEAARDPLVVEREMLRPVVQEDGTAVPISAPPVKYSRTPLSIRRGASALGAHNEEILDELGVDAATRRRLRELKVM